MAKEGNEQLLREARERIAELEEFVASATTPPLVFGTVAMILDKKNMIVAMGGTFTEMPIPTGIKAEVGWMLAMSMESKLPVYCKPSIFPGPLMSVRRRISLELIEVVSAGAINVGGGKTVICNIPVEIGDIVQLDFGSNVVTHNLGPDQNAAAQVKTEEFQRVLWTDIGGLDNIKEFFHNVLELPLLSPEIYKAYNVPTPKGCLMSGPPGCGKTLIGKAVVTDLLAKNKSNASDAFIYIKGPEILSPFVGVTEQNVREAFEKARKFKKANGFPAIMFIDEAEALLNRRGSGRSSDVDRTIVPAFLADMDGLEDSGALVLLATNRPEALDPAVIRPGRIDYKVEVPRPNATATEKIFSINLRKFPLTKGVTLEEMTLDATRYLFADHTHTLFLITRDDNSRQEFAMRHALSGAFIATAVQKAATHALARDIKAKKVAGVTPQDVRTAIDELVHQERKLSEQYRSEVDDFIGDTKDTVVSVTRVL